MDLFSYLLGKKSAGGQTPNLQAKEITITTNTTTTITPDVGYDGLSSVAVTTDVSGGSGLDWNAIGYNSTPPTITNGYNYAKQIYDNWDDTVSMQEKYKEDKELIIFPLVSLGNSQTTLSNCFRGCLSLIEISPIDMSRVSNINYCFYDCTALKYVPVFNLSSITSMTNTFSNCKSLSDSALDNILQSCITATSLYSNQKSLSRIGLNSTTYPATKIQTLPHYQAFIDAGWTIGY